MKFLKRMLGVTLLEIMLVLAIAAMIIVMSVRYYQSATSSSQANTALAEVQGIMAAMDNLAQASGSYSTGYSSAALAALLPTNALALPWGQTITITATTGAYTMTLNSVPTAICSILNSKLTSNNHITTASTCSSAVPSSMAYTYTASV